MLRIDSLVELTADVPQEFGVVYEPEQSGSTKIVLTAPSDALEVTRVQATLSDGTVFAARTRNTQRDGARVTTVDLGQIAEPVRLIVTLRALVPVRSREASIDVTAGSENAEIRVAIVGDAKFVPARSGIRLQSDNVRPGERVELEAVLVNDGTAVATGALLCLRVPSGVSMTAKNARRELHGENGAMLVLPLDEVGVGASVTKNIIGTLDRVIPNGEQLRFEGHVLCGEQQFDLAPLMVTVSSTSTLVVEVRLTDERAYRAGERVMGHVAIKAEGSDVLRDVIVRFSSEGLAFTGADDTGVLGVRFGDVPPLSQLGYLVSATVTATPAGEEVFDLTFEGESESGARAAGSTPVRVFGESQVAASIAVRELPEESAYEVGVTVRNNGDGRANAVAVAAVRTEGIVGIVDSLAVDGTPRLSLDGSIAVERDGIEIGELPVETSREVRWKVRSGLEQDVALAARIVVDGTELVVNAPVLSYHPGHRVTFVEVLTSTEAAEPIVKAAAAPREPEVPAVPIVAAIAPVVSPVPVIVPEAALAAAPAAEGTEAITVRFEVTPTAQARWKAWFGEHGPDNDVELGRLVLAAREFLPLSIGDATANEVLAEVRAGSNDIVTARLLTWKSTNTIGASGFDFFTSALRKNVAALWDRIATVPATLEGPRGDSALVALIGGGDSPYADAIDAFRDRLLEVLDNLESVEDYADVYPDLQPVAARLFDVLCEVEEVAA
jgi:hypothetical protein